MKQPILLAAMLLLACFSAHAQLPINQGDSFTHSFSSLSGGPAPTPFGSRASFYLYGWFDDPQMQYGFWPVFGETQGSLRFDIFENVGDTSPTLSGWLFAFPGADPPATQGDAPPPFWQDLEGSLRISVTAGPTVTFHSLALLVDIEGSGAFRGNSVLVPEPSTLTLLGVGVMVGFCVRRFRRFRGNE